MTVDVKPDLSVSTYPPSDNQFRMSILERLEQMEHRMAEMASQQQASGGSSESGGSGGNSSGNQSQVFYLQK